ncbi:MAG: OmpA family protein [Paludibacteraceae bacterium]|nr:OmpA family protein [Paludibacteraceae bacterium]MBP6284410.1 OmpA family protein [Paludibacteraceae bacterium]
MKHLLLFIALTLLLGSCVTQQKYNELKDSEERYYDEARLYEKDLFELKAKHKDMSSELAKVKILKEKAEADTAKLAQELARLSFECLNLQEQSKELIEKLRTSKSEDEFKSLMAEVHSLQDELMRREDVLFKAERLLLEKQKELDLQNSKMNELNALITQKEQKLEEIRTLVTNALRGLEGNGLSITLKDGRIYVSLEEDLLFQSGKWAVDNRGVQALNRLANVLAQNNDIHILVEGHTDDVPYKGTGNIQDNWDLSVKRATSIVRILLNNREISPARITAAGRGEYMPIATGRTSDARKTNRRTEIILTPNLDELMKIFE